MTDPTDAVAAPNGVRLESLAGEFVLDVYGDRWSTLVPFHEPIGSGEMAVGGLLPPDAVSAFVLDGRGERCVAAVNGPMWIAVGQAALDDFRLPVAFQDEAGGFTWERPPLAGTEPVLDSAVACPVCSSGDWRTRGADGDSTGVVLCWTCGYRVDLVAVSVVSHPEALATPSPSRDTPVAPRDRNAVAYVPRSASLPITARDYQSDLARIEFSAGAARLSVTVEPDRMAAVPEIEARRALNNEVRGRLSVPPDLLTKSVSAITLDYDRRARAAREIAARAPLRIRRVRIDDQLVDLAVVETAAVTVGSTRHAGYATTIVAENTSLPSDYRRE